MKHFGLIGFPLGHSFSKKYFTQKFSDEKINASYELYELENIQNFPQLVQQIDFSGLNVTIPYKEQIIPFLDELDDTARAIGAVNVIKFSRTGNQIHLKGYNSDAIGFLESIRPHIKPWHQEALILGTGGASKAIKYGLEQMGIMSTFVSRTAKPGMLTYSQLLPETIEAHTLIVNATPLGTFPKTDECPDIPYHCLGPKHLLFDVVYNPEKTLFLQRAEQQGCDIVNGSGMLTGQAIAAWNIWNS